MYFPLLDGVLNPLPSKEKKKHLSKQAWFPKFPSKPNKGIFREISEWEDFMNYIFKIKELIKYTNEHSIHGRLLLSVLLY